MSKGNNGCLRSLDIKTRPRDTISRARGQSSTRRHQLISPVVHTQQRKVMVDMRRRPAAQETNPCPPNQSGASLYAIRLVQTQVESPFACF